MRETMERTTSAKGLRLAIAVSRYHHEVTAALERGAVEAFEAAEGDRGGLTVVPSAGAFELIAVSGALVRRPDVDGVAALGCVIRGETPHDQYICQSVADGLQHLIVKHGKPIAFGLLTCLNLEQAKARSGGAQGNKGAEAMTALIETVGAMRRIEQEQEGMKG
jgi:6,7-dimethyl-8-ribityllumazine synthase